MFKYCTSVLVIKVTKSTAWLSKGSKLVRRERERERERKGTSPNFGTGL